MLQEVNSNLINERIINKINSILHKVGCALKIKSIEYLGLISVINIGEKNE
jgi:hypothetical protein